MTDNKNTDMLSSTTFQCSEHPCSKWIKDDISILVTLHFIQKIQRQSLYSSQTIKGAYKQTRCGHKLPVAMLLQALQLAQQCLYSPCQVRCRVCIPFSTSISHQHLRQVKTMNTSQRLRTQGTSPLVCRSHDPNPIIVSSDTGNAETSLVLLFLKPVDEGAACGA
jgi:hypothetical protein